MYQFYRDANYKVAKRWQWKKLGGAHIQPLSLGVMQSPCIRLPAHASCRYFRKDPIRSNSLSLDADHLGGTTNSSATYVHYSEVLCCLHTTGKRSSVNNWYPGSNRASRAAFYWTKNKHSKPIPSESDNKWPQNQGPRFKYPYKIKFSPSLENNSCFFFIIFII